GFSLLELVASRRDDPRLFRLCSWALTLPVIAAGVLRPTFMHPRYFFTMLPFLLLLLARAVETGLRANGTRAVLALVMLMVVVAGQYGNVRKLQADGRGQYRAALQFMREQTGAQLLVGSDHDFRNRMLIDYIRQD